jgi:hypothetical protein
LRQLAYALNDIERMAAYNCIGLLVWFRPDLRWLSG